MKIGRVENGDIHEAPGHVAKVVGQFDGVVTDDASLAAASSIPGGRWLRDILRAGTPLIISILEAWTAS